MMPIPHPCRWLGGGGLLDQRGHVRDWAPPGWYWEILPSGGTGWWGVSPSLTRTLFCGGRMGQWLCQGFRTPRRCYVTVSARRTSTSVATWLRWTSGSPIPGMFFRDSLELWSCGGSFSLGVHRDSTRLFDSIRFALARVMYSRPSRRCIWDYIIR